VQIARDLGFLPLRELQQMCGKLGELSLGSLQLLACGCGGGQSRDGDAQGGADKRQDHETRLHQVQVSRVRSPDPERTERDARQQRGHGSEFAQVNAFSCA